MASSLNRRAHQRFSVNPSYTPIQIRPIDKAAFSISGNAYDISEGGMRLDVDVPIAAGQRVAVEIPVRTSAAYPGPGRSVFAIGTVIWLADEDEPAPYRTAIAFQRFARSGDRERLMASISGGRGRMAA